MPPVITIINSERVSLARNGRIVSGASFIPMKTLAATFRDSAPETPSVFCITAAMPRTASCITPSA